MVASQSGYVEVVRLLLDYEAEINLQSEVTTMLLYIEMIIVVCRSVAEGQQTYLTLRHKRLYISGH